MYVRGVIHQKPTGAAVLHFPVIPEASKISLFVKAHTSQADHTSPLWSPSLSNCLPQLTSALQSFNIYCRGSSKSVQNPTQYSWLFQNALWSSAKAMQNLL